jgi:hypothetical protein
VKDRHRIFAGTYSVLWTILLAAFVVLGGREVWIGPSEAKFVHPGPSASVDADFEAFFDAPNGSQRCLEILRRLFGKGTIVFFCPPRNPPGALGFDLISYLSWPQEMHKVEVDRTRLEEATRSLDRPSTSAIIFCNVQLPAEFSRGWRIGPSIFIAPLDHTK